MHRHRGRRHFAVSVLAADQEHVARYFADRRRPLGAAQFDAVDWRPGRLTGAPLITGALACSSARCARDYEGGDHTIFVGRLLSAEKLHEEDAVLFLHGRFRQITPMPSGAVRMTTVAPRVVPGATGSRCSARCGSWSATGSG